MRCCVATGFHWCWRLLVAICRLQSSTLHLRHTTTMWQLKEDKKKINTYVLSVVGQLGLLQSIYKKSPTAVGKDGVLCYRCVYMRWHRNFQIVFYHEWNLFPNVHDRMLLANKSTRFQVSNEISDTSTIEVSNICQNTNYICIG